MADENIAARDAELQSKLAIQEKDQPDPFLQLSTGRMSGGGLALAVVAVVAILGVVLYGLNGHKFDGVATPAATSQAAVAAGKAGPPPTTPQTAPQTANGIKG